MRSLSTLVLLAGLGAAPRAEAQLSNRSISLESGLSLPSGGTSPVSIPVAIAATAWVEGPFDAVARVAYGAAAQPFGRGTARRVEGTAGLRWSWGTGALRPQLQLEAGWSRVAGASGVAAGGVAAAAGAGLEAFAQRDLALAVRASLRLSPGEGLRPELTLGASFYF